MSSELYNHFHCTIAGWSAREGLPQARGFAQAGKAG
jgi:hypothetical protein